HEALGQSGWFRVGDQDLALSLRRTEWLMSGRSRAAVARDMRDLLGVSTTVLPSSAEPHRTSVRSVDVNGGNWLSFQEFLVKYRAAPEIQAVRIEPRSKRSNSEASFSMSADLVVFGPS